MASTIVTKNSSTASAVPVSGDLTQGELAVNVTDKRLFTKNSGGTVVELGTNPASLALPNGTANGVAYLNGSKVLTTGTALTFDGTGLSVTGSTSATLKLNGRASDNASSANFYDNTGATRYGFIYFDASTAQIASANTTPLAFLLNGSEQMRLTSTGLGIGTTSPGVKLDVSGAIRSIVSGGTPIIYFNNGTTQHSIANSSGAMPFTIDGAEGMRLTSTGLGIGTSSPLGTLGIAGSATTTIVIPRSSNGTTATPVETQLIGSAFTNGTYPAGIYALNSFTNNSGNWLTFKTTDTGNTTATRMTLDSSGNLGLGVTPSAWSGLTAYQVKSGSFANNSTLDRVYLLSNAYYNAGFKYVNSNPACRFDVEGTSGSFAWYTAPSGTAGNAITFTQAMTLDASGNLLVGATSASGNSNLRVSSSTTRSYALIDTTATTGAEAGLRLKASRDWYTISDYDSGALKWYDATAGADRMRIDTSGNLLVGTTSVINGGKISSNTGAAGSGLSTQFSAAAGSSVGLWSNYNNTTGTAWHAYFTYNGTGVGTIQSTSTTTSYNTSSDYRLKHDVAPMTGALAKVAALKPVTYKWNADNSDGEGFIAHELAEVVPQCVTGEKDAVDAEGNPVYQGIDTSFLVATLTAAIQEQQALITQLQADVAALKGN